MISIDNGPRACFTVPDMKVPQTIPVRPGRDLARLIGSGKHDQNQNRLG